MFFLKISKGGEVYFGGVCGVPISHTCFFISVQPWPTYQPREALPADVGKISKVAECSSTVTQNKCLLIVSSAFRAICESLESTGGRGVRDPSNYTPQSNKSKTTYSYAGHGPIVHHRQTVQKDSEETKKLHGERPRPHRHPRSPESDLGKVTRCRAGASVIVDVIAVGR